MPRSFTAEDEHILCDLTTLTINFFELNQVAVTDSLTGAMTRRAFKEEAPIRSRTEHSLSRLNAFPLVNSVDNLSECCLS